MLQNYFKSTDSRVSDEEHKRLVATNAALEIVKAAVSAPTNSKNISYDFEEVIKHLPNLVDVIQKTIENK
ncbi:TPA: hypothetical protein U5D73_000273 [Yersinia enterocolitica]|uniref:hypothetical protein n=1 Tax=Yersinia enterocolitica TaxID=630 RepID=UPI0021E8321F|nr:hypothetical protein [Yersinia enterocolitica]EKN4862557.1 hypothetical protein [Yersinia enterocolitica]EMA9253768.1 hypothetical protein [Yersinia enterocolitica]EMA9428518.1 hypothetical protein [Yersinia enterocolitica]UYK07499.1 hypothetical protein N4218_06730 [Yersinia enterocolitica]HEI6728489.1 hypothetical protein [Yersinia enterocolitica]